MPLTSSNWAVPDLTAARVTSYWNGYYRWNEHYRWRRYRSAAEYPGRLLIDAVRAAGREHTAAADGSPQ